MIITTKMTYLPYYTEYQMYALDGYGKKRPHCFLQR